ncbi:hypothetical protein QBC33DRAFT_493656 [Phialemonium atrogriseum]|uniref:Ubiquinol-cytochrome-c reductase complex assembly factor 2 n=1 Tax=Phialemonium atrogriseum TaxID=1093897 RepID=A0AAJ0FMY1_9PEZI|nr:uncharacterized protein QBC33DRAFT_493656 [Phialemonium atrogriseum]KAK1766605.1 hypothetical protein QBC33DRAFT_493656 [Phialemonium atrogriseum]
MTTPVRSVAYKHFQRVLAQWPKDRLRPESQLQDVLTKRIDKQFAERKAGSAAGLLSEEAELKQVNAMYSLLEDRYKTKYRILGQLMEPRSNPAYYNALMTELEEVPTRTWYQRIANRLGGMIRLQ